MKATGETKKLRFQASVFEFDRIYYGKASGQRLGKPLQNKGFDFV
ncbi:hypothetical protein ACSAZL_06145 [Methanosarcina sp. T3]